MSHRVEIRIGDAILRGELSGSGVSVVFLHAGVADRRMWADQMTYFSRFYQVFSYDRRGFGETESPDEPFSHVEDLAEMLEQLGISSAILIGCSQGGRIAIDFCLQYPDRVLKLGLVAPAISGQPSPETVSSIVQARLDALDEADDLDMVNEIEAILWLDGPTSPAGRVSGPARALFLDMNGKALAADADVSLTHEQEPPSAYDRLDEISQPALVSWGDLDFEHIRNRCQHITRTISNTQTHVFSGCAHLPNLEKPAQFNERLERFLRG